LLRGYDTKDVDGITDAWRAMPWTGSMFLAAALALCGLPLSGVFRSEFQIVAGGFARPQYVGVTVLLVGVNLAFFGIIWHAARMVLGRPADLATDGAQLASAHVAGERSAWMIAGMLGCLFVSVALGVHLPGQLSALLNSAAHRLAVPS
jgi:hydrogenase-4 component F